MPLFTSSTPPLNPIANSRYSENNLATGGGISKSDLTKTATMPKKNARTGGFKMLDTIKLTSISTNPPSLYVQSKVKNWLLHVADMEMEKIYSSTRIFDSSLSIGGWCAIAFARSTTGVQYNYSHFSSHQPGGRGTAFKNFAPRNKTYFSLSPYHLAFYPTENPCDRSRVVQRL